ncbi:MAG: hypothetical protein P0Y53_18700 [Candidatus Pseudobacter hemicellulosilyticus]|uniref:Uncharacterized protein n=1 Tax=Candidatus Pseudobacter hemicellulosilyticus TaxID=3121375 RepID=A0AAJ6BGU9_9BACT|nr:MAG: hypothetical protein P0Y53_18700 [Pseudobacter sp.]
MKKIFSFLAGLLITTNAISQWLSQSAEGKGTVLSKGATVSLDVAKTDISFSLNNLNRPVWVQGDSAVHRFFFGAALSAKNEEGIGNLFSKGDFVPSSRLTGFWGVKLLDNQPNFRKEEERLNAVLQDLTNRQVVDFQIRTASLIRLEVEERDNLAKNIRDKISSDWIEEVKTSVAAKFIAYLKKYQQNNAFVAQNVDVANIIADVIAGIKAMVKEFDIEQNKLRKELEAHYKGFVESNQTNLSVFTFGGIDASSFKRVDSIHTTDLPASFSKEEFRGGIWGIGLNYQTNRLKIGFTYAYRKTNNFSLLDKTDYTLTSMYTSGGQELKQSKEITAYTGKYGKVEVNELNLDVLYTIGLGKGADTYAMLNAYLRSNMFSRDEELLPGSFNIGVASYFFTRKSKFLGGLYVELPDVDDSYEKSKPDDKQNIRPAIRRLTFGIVGKFSINSLISWQ